MKQEFSVKPISGYVAALAALLLLGGAIAGFAYAIIWQVYIPTTTLRIIVNTGTLHS